MKKINWFRVAYALIGLLIGIGIASIIFNGCKPVDAASINKFDRTKAVVITDSYGGRDYSEGNLYWILTTCFNCNISQYEYCNGHGFNANRGEWASWTDRLEQDFKSDKTVGQVIVIGGYNDINNPRCDNIYHNACDFIETAHRKFPNAKIKLVCVGHKPDCDPTRNIGIEETVKGLWYAATENYSYAYYIWNADTVLQDSEFMADKIHPTDRGCYDIGAKVTFMIKNDVTFFFED